MASEPEDPLKATRSDPGTPAGGPPAILLVCPPPSAPPAWAVASFLDSCPDLLTPPPTSTHSNPAPPGEQPSPPWVSASAGSLPPVLLRSLQASARVPSAGGVPASLAGTGSHVAHLTRGLPTA